MHFSYSTLNWMQTHSHCWINKMMGIKQERKYYFEEGTKAHRLIQNHVAGIEVRNDLDYLNVSFPLVEEKNFDEKLKFKFEYRGYQIIGYFDGWNFETRQFLEIKSSATPWSIAKFKKADQRKMYALASTLDSNFPIAKEAILITGSRDPRDWATKRLKVCKVPIVDKDYEDAKKFMDKGIDIFESGDFNGGLEDGRCVDRWCPWGNKCHFKGLGAA